MNYFYQNFVVDGAWKPFVTGLSVTVLITVASLLIGTALGAVLCAMVRSKYPLLRAISKWYTIIVRGTPVLLLLMLFYYVILAPLRTDAVITAFIAFGLNCAAHIGQIMQSGLSGVDDNEIEAALSLGFSKLGAFFVVQLPQAVRIAKPVYQNAVVNLLQWTTVVGYISITDLTRVVNNMGSRTGQPFIALAVGMIAYLLLAWVTHLFFNMRFKVMRST
ncbi:MAG: amino acid ABC transporter permease [Lachnospiraceae bacterium]|jgi:polar amino acid transport system permease protein/polar amino acid transport system substrate-binding protein|nr:amino acid ABC transporter permease [Lachnospiraceae bacterium]